MAWRVARSLDKLLEQINARYPNRNKASDGSIGDAAHASRTSDHNPWVKDGAMGVVTARDFTHDPAHGVDIDRLTDELAASRDPRIKYIIANGLILDSRQGYNPWRWVRYTGSNPHTKHFHLSVMPSKHLYDDTRPWNLPSLTGGGGGAAPAPTPKPLPTPSSSLLLLQEDSIMRFEAVERGTMTLPIPERDVCLQIQLAGEGNTPPSHLQIHSIQFVDGDGKKRTVTPSDPNVPAGDPWWGDWLAAQDHEVSAIIRYSYTGDGAAKHHVATAGWRRNYSN